MSQRQFFESQALTAALLEGGELLGIASLETLAEKIPEADSARLNDALTDLFADGRLADCVSVSGDVDAAAAADSFGWRMGRKVRNGITQKARFIRLK